MADLKNEIRGILSEADEKLLDLIAKCAKSGDLVGVDAGRSMAQRLRSISASLATGYHSDDRHVKRQHPVSEGSKRKKGYRQPSKFPRFEVRNTTLCRVGWSKKKKEQYEHKVPRGTVYDVIEGMVSLGRSGPGPFTAEQIIKRANQKSTVTVPSYQAYVVIGWLREHDLIEQLGRDGYQIPDGLEASAERAWNPADSRTD